GAYHSVATIRGAKQPSDRFSARGGPDDNIAVVAPMPSAIVITATKVKPGDFRGWRSANVRSFMSFGAQCLDWINVCGTTGREQTCNQRNRCKQNGRARKQRRIVRRNLIQLRGNQAPEREC